MADALSKEFVGLEVGWLKYEELSSLGVISSGSFFIF